MKLNQVKDFLDLCKPSCKTYCNLRVDQKQDIKNKYNYLKTQSDKFLFPYHYKGILKKTSSAMDILYNTNKLTTCIIQTEEVLNYYKNMDVK